MRRQRIRNQDWPALRSSVRVTPSYLFTRASVRWIAGRLVEYSTDIERSLAADASRRSPSAVLASLLMAVQSQRPPGSSVVRRVLTSKQGRNYAAAMRLNRLGDDQDHGGQAALYTCMIANAEKGAKGTSS
jgi:hypothetical protein